MKKSDEEEALAAEIGASATGEPPASNLAPDVRPHLCDVLIADDAGPSRQLLAGILRNFVGQLDLREARDGHDAVKLWRDFNPRITLLDIDMPGLNGLEALTLIRQEASGAFVAMISAGSAIANVKKALELGAAGYVVKPYKPQRILDVLTKYRDVSGHDLQA